ncbi:GNAT family N-acetyltransferase [Flaviflagellibacter deserti]|uniref:GNAT family N-acetyltransferase n=1 Tax=Flaviflagellibacter deserti TaxID=2267266 RepID=A0ABV9Z629_9HYPH
MLSLLFPTMVEVAGLFGDVPHEGHLTGIEQVFGDERVMRTLGGVRPPRAAKAFIGRERAHWREHSYGMWFFRDLETGDFAGWGGIRRTEVDGEEAVELAYTLVPEKWGQGCATAIGKLATQLGFENLGLTDIVAFALTDNTRSEAVMVRCGFTFEKPIERAGLPHVLYRLKAGSSSSGLTGGSIGRP